MAIIIIVLLFIVVDIAALLWGADSRDKMDSCEWERRGRFFLGSSR